MLYTLKTWFLPWLVIADLSRDISKSDEALHRAEMQADSAEKQKWKYIHERDRVQLAYRAAIAERDDARDELATLKAKQPVHGARGRFVSKAA